MVVNGNPAHAETVANALAARARRATLITLRVWSLALGDKANAFNVYLHDLRPETEGATVFVDGYVRVHDHALRALDLAFEEKPEALAASGVPTRGFSAQPLRRTMLREGGIHGNLFALRAATVDLMRRRGYRLPLGLYRTDATLGAALAFGMDPARHPWDPQRYIAVSANATWDIDPQRWWHPAVWRQQWRRRQRQAQGDLENRAVSYCYAQCAMPIEALPSTARELVGLWVDAQPNEASAYLNSSRIRRAFEALQAPRDWSHRCDVSEIPSRLAGVQ